MKVKPSRQPRAKLETFELSAFKALMDKPTNAPQFGWRFVVNGRVLAQSVESYTRRRVARRAFRSMAAHIAAGTWREAQDPTDGR